MATARTAGHAGDGILDGAAIIVGTTGTTHSGTTGTILITEAIIVRGIAVGMAIMADGIVHHIIATMAATIAAKTAVAA